MSIRTKVVFSFGIIFAIILAVFTVQMISSEDELSKIKRIEDRTLRSALLADDMKLNVVQVLRHLTDVGATRMSEGFEEAKKYKEQFDSNLDAFAQLNPDMHERIAEIREAFASYYELGNQMAEDYISRGTSAGNKTMWQFNQVANDMNEKVDTFREEQLNDISRSITEIREIDHSRNLSLLWSVVGIVLLGSLTAFMLVRSLLVPIRQLIQTSSHIAAGDLSQPLVYRRKDEFASLSNSFEQMRLNLAMLIGNVQQASLHVAASTEQLSGNADEYSRTTNQMTQSAKRIAGEAEQQFYSISEASRAIEEMTIGIQRIAELAGHTAELSTDAERQAKQGYERIERATQQMRSIYEAVHHTSGTVAQLDSHSQQISGIIETIAEIAKLTNLLALNASIEAARAGEHGSGFAVVAREVYKLAGRTKESSEQVARILERIALDTKLVVADMDAGAKEVENGMLAIDDAGISFEEIIKANEHIAGRLSEVSASTEQLSAGSQQIAASFSELSRFAETSSVQAKQVSETMEGQLGSMEDIAKLTRSLRAMSEQLEQDTIRFKV